MMQRIALIGLWIICQFANLVAALWMFFSILFGSPRAWKIAVSYDQLANTVFGGNEDETISSRAYKASISGKKWGCILCKLLNKIQPNHCESSVELDRGKSLPSQTTDDSLVLKIGKE